MSEQDSSKYHYVISLDPKARSGNLEYFKDKNDIVKKLVTIFHPGCTKPRLKLLSDDIVDAMSREEFNSYCAAMRKFHDNYWPYSTLVLPIQMKPGERTKKLVEIEKFYKELYRSEPTKWGAAIDLVEL